MKTIKVSKWEPDARKEPEPRTEPEARTEPVPRMEPAPKTEQAPKTEPASRTEPMNKIQSVKCPSCGYLLVISKGPEKQSLTCTKCGNVFQEE
jgi:ribosomal protein S27E